MENKHRLMKEVELSSDVWDQKQDRFGRFPTKNTKLEIFAGPYWVSTPHLNTLEHLSFRLAAFWISDFQSGILRAVVHCPRRALGSASKEHAPPFWKQALSLAHQQHPQPSLSHAGYLLSGFSTFGVDFGEQLAQWPLHLPAAADEGGHYPEQLVLVFLPDHRDCLQDKLHLLQLMSPWGGKHQVLRVLLEQLGTVAKGFWPSLCL